VKTIYSILVCIFCFLLFFNGCIVNIVDDPASASAAAGDQPSVIKLAALALLAVYEVVVRIVPSVGDYSAVSWIIRLLKKVSDTLNVRI
jgi:hypothetical protein